MIAPVRTLSYLYEQHFRPIRHKQSPLTTIKFYQGKIALFEAYLGTPLDIDYIRQEHLDGYIGSRQCKAATLNGDLRVIKALLRFARKRKYVKRRPLIEMQPELLDDPEAHSIEELQKILQAASDEPGAVCGLPAGDYYLTLLLVILNTGSRISAIMQARLDDYDRATGILRRRASTQKQRKTQSDLLDPVVRARLEHLLDLQPQRERLFPTASDQTERARTMNTWNALRQSYKRILVRAGLKPGRKQMFHKLRKSSATFIAAASDLATAQRVMGHSTDRVTQRYIDPRRIAPPSVASMIPWSSLLPTQTNAG